MDIGLRLCPFLGGLTLVAGSAFAQAPNPTRTPVALVARAADEPQRRWNRLGRRTAAAASRARSGHAHGIGATRPATLNVAASAAILSMR